MKIACPHCDGLIHISGFASPLKAVVDDVSGATISDPRRRPVHRARGILGEANSCPQCKARQGEPCIFDPLHSPLTETTAPRHTEHSDGFGPFTDQPLDTKSVPDHLKAEALRLEALGKIPFPFDPGIPSGHVSVPRLPDALLPPPVPPESETAAEAPSTGELAGAQHLQVDPQADGRRRVLEPGDAVFLAFDAKRILGAVGGVHIDTVYSGRVTYQVSWPVPAEGTEIDRERTYHPREDLIYAGFSYPGASLPRVGSQAQVIGEDRQVRVTPSLPFNPDVEDPDDD